MVVHSVLHLLGYDHLDEGVEKARMRAREEAILAGREAVRAAMAGKTGVMVGFERQPGAEYRSRTILIPIEQVMLSERTMPDEFIASSGWDVTPAFLDWCRPLIGGDLPSFVSFR